MNPINLEWRKSSFSTAENACVEVAWRKSNYSNTENACVEVAILPRGRGCAGLEERPRPHAGLPRL